MSTLDRTQETPKTNYRIMKLHEFPKSTFYRAACDCTDKDHDMSIEICIDTFPILELHFHWNAETTVFWGSNKWFGRQWKKLRLATKILFKGIIETEGEFIFYEKAHIDDFITALQEGRDRLIEAHKNEETPK